MTKLAPCAGHVVRADQPFNSLAAVLLVFSESRIYWDYFISFNEHLVLPFLLAFELLAYEHRFDGLNDRLIHAHVVLKRRALELAVQVGRQAELEDGGFHGCHPSRCIASAGFPAVAFMFSIFLPSGCARLAVFRFLLANPT